MTAVTVEEAQAHLPDLIAALKPGDGLVITRDHQPIAQLFPIPIQKPRAIAGRCKGMLTIVAEDDEHLEDFKEYME